MVAAFERKIFNLKALDVDTNTKSVKVAIAELETVDRDNDVFSPTAFDKTIKERGPSGTNEIWHLVDHETSVRSALGKFKELYREGKYIVGVSQYKDSALWRDTVWPLYEAGDINQHSVGYTTMKSQKAKAGHREITEAALWEGSAVLFAANPNTPTLGVTKSMNKQEAMDAYSKRFDLLIKSIKGGRFNEDNSLLIIELKQLQQILFDLSERTTEPEEKATQPDSVQELIDIKSALNNTIQGLFKHGS